MYKCNRCGHIFEKPYIYLNQEYYGAEQVLADCPNCYSGDYEEAELCRGCDRLYTRRELTEGFCIDCEKEIQDKVTGFFRQFNEDEKTYILTSGILEEV